MSIKERIKRKIEKYKRIRHKGGHGIHSPFAFRLITEVVEERHGYYRLREFRKILRQTKKQKRNEGRQIRSQRYYALIFRLLNRFQSDQMIQVGTHFGLLQLLVQMIERETPYYWIEQDTQKIKQAEEFLIEATNQVKPALLPLQTKRLMQISEVDFSIRHLLIIHTSGIEDLQLSDLNEALEKVDPEGIWVIDAITFNPRMKQLWLALRAHPHVVASFDLIDIGILVFNPKIHRENYKLFF